MAAVLQLLACYGLVFFLADSHICEWPRSLISERLEGSIAYEWYEKLLSCYFCMGFHAGWFAYLMRALFVSHHFNLVSMVGWGFASATFCYILNCIVEWFESNARYQPEDN
jgi:hypothetical protein